MTSPFRREEELFWKEGRQDCAVLPKTINGLERTVKTHEIKWTQNYENEHVAALIIKSSVWMSINRIRMALIIPLIAAMALMFSCQTEDLFDSPYKNETLSSSSLANAPLILIDGIIYPGNFNDINPHELLSICVLKDAGTIGIYGSRASNGVVLITTKNGKGKIKPND